MKLAENPQMLREVRFETARVLELEGQEAFVQANLPGGDGSAAQDAGAGSEALENATEPVNGPVGNVENADEETRLESATDD